MAFGENERGAGASGFEWPPRARGEPRRAPSGAEPARGVRRSWREWARDAERFWLDTAAEGAHARLARAGFTPDAPSAYCFRCGRSTGPFEADASGCRACRGRILSWLGVTRLGEYEQPLKGLVWEVKFTRFRSVGVELGMMLGGSVRGSLGAVGREVDVDRTLVCWVGMAVPRRIARGIDHAGALGEGVARGLGVQRARLLARRWSWTDPQTGRGRVARRRGVRNTMRLARAIPDGVDLVVIVDDVMTTGETMREACRAISAGCAQAGRATPSLWPALVCVTQEARAM